MPSVPPGSTARCKRCGAVLRRAVRNSLDHVLAAGIAGLILYGLANFLPFMSLRIEGQVQDASLASGALQLLKDGLWQLAGIVVLTTLVAPLLKIGAIVYVLLGLGLRRPPRHLRSVFRWVELLHPWAMLEVYMLGVFVAYVKLAGMATIQVGVALYALAALMVLMAWVNSILDDQAVWEELSQRGIVNAPDPVPNAPLIRCHGCSLMVSVGRTGGHGTCPRCGARLHRRKPNSLSAAWALVIAAIILYVPANLFPVMTVISFGSGEPDTILSGVQELLQAGMWPLALLVFFASITVPVLKIIALILLLVSTQVRARWRLRDRTVLYRIVEAVGRWSMIDIFMLSILVALVRLGSIATIEPGVGAISFAAVVVITMFAATAFDSRLMWDAASQNHG